MRRLIPSSNIIDLTISERFLRGERVYKLDSVSSYCLVALTTVQWYCYILVLKIKRCIER